MKHKKTKTKVNTIFPKQEGFIWKFTTQGIEGQNTSTGTGINSLLNKLKVLEYEYKHYEKN